jgi:A/G-specific adenine glycosylase
MSAENICQFRGIIYAYYRKHGRSFPWRQTSNPYHILVSEIMLQQTQTSRIVQKYPGFISEFPDFDSLAAAPLSAILKAWQGLGYNRRALALQKTSQTVMNSFGGMLPSSPEILVTLPGIGKYTAAAIAVFAFNRPEVFIETNIRTVFTHFFFQDSNTVADKQIEPLVNTVLDRENPCQWYYALFDYGVMLKKTGNLARKSAHYRKQSPFKGSNREIRSQVVRLLLDNSPLSEVEIIKQLNWAPERVTNNLRQLQTEGLIGIAESKSGYCIKQ